MRKNGTRWSPSKNPSARLSFLALGKSGNLIWLWFWWDCVAKVTGIKQISGPKWVSIELCDRSPLVDRHFMYITLRGVWAHRTNVFYSKLGA